MGSKSKSDTNHRLTLFDYVAVAEKGVEANKYCTKTVLNNEASVEQFFVQRLINDLGYKDEEIKPKEALSSLVVSHGRKKEKYKPDYVFVCADRPRWLIDAKGTKEDVDDWAYQGAGYALQLNQQFKDEDPCKYYVITNGLVLKVWVWNDAEPALVMEFSDFVEDNPKFTKLLSLLGADSARTGFAQETKAEKPATVSLKKPSVEEAKRIFKNCHNLIWKAEQMSPQPAFFEFVKIMFVKLWQDKKLHSDPELGQLVKAGQPIPRDQLVFSTKWIESLEAKGVQNPVDQVLFDRLVKTLKEAVVKGKKKPIFEENEHIRLNSGTVKQVVSRLEMYDMFGIDEDLNGRLFETFLSATMRGQALGQFFTPRSIVKLMERIAEPKASRIYIDHVLDACCGTGGFLIEALTDMRNQVRTNTTLSNEEASELYEQVANEALFGIDAGRDPPLARIARINMYLHGDGGSRIYAVDSLDKEVLNGVGDDPQSKLEADELRPILIKGGWFDIVLTNPPFSMGYSAILPSQARIIEKYALTKYGYGGTSKHRTSLSSRIMFIERYAELLKPGGKLLTVIDDATLSTKKYDFARKFIRDKFIVRAVISLPGDAFQRVGARAKTSILYLIKRGAKEVGQPDVFMTESNYIGVDDVPTKTPKSKADEARLKAENETKSILEAFQKFLGGEKGPWLVPNTMITDRLDVKWCLPRTADVSSKWKEQGYEVLPLSSIVEHVSGEELKPKESPTTEFTFLRVRYDGIPEVGETRLGKEITYTNLQRAKETDLVISNIAMVLGATCVLPKELEHTLISSEFTIMRIKDTRFIPWFLWGFLRSPEVRARLLSKATGISRHRVSWDFLKDIPVPLVNEGLQKKIGEKYQQAVQVMRDAEVNRRKIDTMLSDKLDLSNEWAVNRLRAAKPPK
jgi:type I restriction enzyme M protein